MKFQENKHRIIRFIKNNLFIISRGLYNPFSIKCFGQDGEDMMLKRIFAGKKNGFYVDVGAHHPFKYSNTYSFYKQGWSGINIDAEPGSMVNFKKYRGRDINIEYGVGKYPGIFTYYRFNEPALNTFSIDEARLKNKAPYCLINEINISVLPLADLLNTHLPKGRKIDFLSIDVEGKDYDVLASNDWELYRPRVVLVETLRTGMLNLDECPVVQFLIAKNYHPFAKVGNTTFFLENER